ncbi:MAG: GWxTD domain-containing protein [Candidatus Aminicenantes bacterium]|nr:GWxTD domain-containing protein [Candidatus Aminicenantes bacterium]
MFTTLVKKALRKGKRWGTICFLLSLFAIGSVLFSNSFSAAPAGGVEGQNKEKQKLDFKKLRKELPAKYQRWLDEVTYIISDYENQGFLQLKTDEQRDLFIERFWLARDPTPGTKKNEFKEEHYKRWEYANKYLGRESYLPGWKTDRGRIYITLGEPALRVPFEDGFYNHTMELWQYISNTQHHLPPGFYLIFYMKDGMPPFRLYRPLTDTAYRLLKPGPDVKPLDEDTQFEFLSKLGYDIAHAAWSYLPSSGGFGTFGSSAAGMESEQLIGDIWRARNLEEESRKDYVDATLTGKAEVEVEVYFRTMTIENLVRWFASSTGNVFYDIALKIEPEDLEVGKYEEQYFINLDLNGTIKDEEENVVDTFSYGLEDIYLDEAKFEQIRYRPMILMFRRALIPGNFHLDLVLRNNVSKEIATTSAELVIPPLPAEVPFMGNLYLVNKITRISEGDKSSQRVKAFQFEDLAISPSVDNIFSREEGMIAFYQIFFPDEITPQQASNYLLSYEISQRGKMVSRVEGSLAELVPSNALVITLYQRLNLEKLSAGKASLDIFLKNMTTGEGVVEAYARADFELVSQPEPECWSYNQAIIPYDSPQYDYFRAKLYMNTGDYAYAERGLMAVLGKNPEHFPANLDYCRLLLLSQRYDELIERASPLLVNSPRHPALLELIGQAYLYKNDYQEARRYYERLRLERPKYPPVLNILSYIYYNLKQTEKAIQLLEESLKLDPAQEEIQERLKKIKSESQ